MSRGKILVVEDEAFIAHDIKKVLDKEGYTTIVDCFNVDLAIELVQQKKPNLVLIDINLGDRKNGIDLAEYLDKVTKLPYIFITSYSDKSTLRKVSEYSPAGYIIKPFKHQDLVSAVFLIMSKLSLTETPENQKKEVPFAITQVLSYIEENIREKLDLEVLAARTDWEPEHFGRIFKESVGLTPYQYVLKCKIERAKELLINSNETFQTIGFDLGFSTYGNFFNAFKKYANMSPEQFRKLMKKD